MLSPFVAASKRRLRQVSHSSRPNRSSAGLGAEEPAPSQVLEPHSQVLGRGAELIDRRYTRPTRRTPSSEVGVHELVDQGVRLDTPAFGFAPDEIVRVWAAARSCAGWPCRTAPSAAWPLGTVAEPTESARIGR